MTEGAPLAARRGLGGAGWVLALALGVRLAVVAWASSRVPPTADGTFYHTIAGRIAQGLGYTWLWPDGAVTYAGHYPVGYPALVGAVYAITGPVPAAAMLLNAVVGALAAVAAYELGERAGGRRVAVAAGVLVAIHPGLVSYTPALMTEGVTASLVVCAGWSAAWSAGWGPAWVRGPGGAADGAKASRSRDVRGVNYLYSWVRSVGVRGWIGPALTGVILGAATLVRPQSVLLAPIFGWLAVRGVRRDVAGWRRRAASRGIGGAVIALVAALAVCAPWAARNCVQMKRCALVSYNGGWNLLIGADEASTGTWAEIKVPPSCREVYDEAEKDACFGAAARRYIADHPAAWLGLVPRKLAATFDYAGAGGWYLHAANAAAFPQRAKVTLGAIETVFERVVLLLALVVGARGAAAVLRRKRSADDERGSAEQGSGERGSRRAWAVVTVIAALPAIASVFWQHVWIGYVLLPVVMLTGRVGGTLVSRSDEEGGGPRPTLFWATAAVLASLGVTHALFFGAGRYSLVAFPFVTAVAALAFEGREAAASGRAGSSRLGS